MRVPLLIGLVAVAGILLWYQQFYSTTMQVITDLELQKWAKEDTLRTIQALKPQRNLLQKEINMAQIRLDSLKSIFPDQKEVPKLIREITGVARASGIITTKFNPLPDIEKEYYIENRYSISVTGGYHQLAEFFAFLANFPLIINYSSMDISVNPEFQNENTDIDTQDMEEISSRTIVANFEMTTFSSKK